jgi:hypothetical protein
MTKPTKLTFDIDPYKGAAAALVGLQIEGMRLVDMKRKGSKAICSYLPIEDTTPGE